MNTAFNKKPSKILKKIEVKKLEFTGDTPIINNIDFCQKTKDDVKIIFDIVYRGKVEVDLDIQFHLGDFTITLYLQILEIYGRMCIEFQQENQGPSKFFFIETPFYKSKIRVKAGPLDVGFTIPLDSYLMFMLNHKLVDDLTEPDYIKIKIPLTEHISNAEVNN